LVALAATGGLRGFCGLSADFEGALQVSVANAIGAPNGAMTPSPVNLSTVPLVETLLDRGTDADVR
jgi:hypothetical protein